MRQARLQRDEGDSAGDHLRVIRLWTGWAASLTLKSGSSCSVRQSPNNPKRWFFDFDAAAPGGRGGASVYLDAGQGLASIDGVYKNVLLPKRSTGALVANGLNQAGMPKPNILEAYNVEKTTLAALAGGGDGRGTLLGNLLEDTAKALGGTIMRWEPVQERSSFHLRVYVSYP